MNSHQGEEDALLRERNPQDPWEQQRSSSGSPEPPQDDPMGEEVVDLWEAEDPPDDDDDSVVEQVTRSSISASNPWVLYEAGIICAREEGGEIIKNSTGEKVIALRELELFALSPKDSIEEATHWSC